MPCRCLAGVLQLGAHSAPTRCSWRTAPAMVTQFPSPIVYAVYISVHLSLPPLPINLTAPSLLSARCPRLLLFQFGSAITYLYEVAPAGRKGLTASWGQVAVSPGMILGILMCQAVLYGCTHGEHRPIGLRHRGGVQGKERVCFAGEWEAVV